MRLTFVRHGQTPSNLVTRLDTNPPGRGLTAEGRAQAAGVAERLAAPVHSLLSSDLLRARQTAEIVGQSLGLESELHPGLREIEAGDLEARNDRDALDTYRAAFLAWARGDLSPRMPGGPDGFTTLARIDAVIEGLDVEHAVLVSHGALIRAWVGARALNPPGFETEPHLANCGLVEVSGRRGAWTAISWEGEPHPG